MPWSGRPGGPETTRSQSSPLQRWAKGGPRTGPPLPTNDKDPDSPGTLPKTPPSLLLLQKMKGIRGKTNLFNLPCHEAFLKDQSYTCHVCFKWLRRAAGLLSSQARLGGAW